MRGRRRRQATRYWWLMVADDGDGVRLWWHRRCEGTPLFFLFRLSSLCLFFFSTLVLGDGGEGEGVQQRVGGGVVGGRGRWISSIFKFFFYKIWDSRIPFYFLFFCVVSLPYLVVSRTHICIVPCLHRYHGWVIVSGYHSWRTSTKLKVEFSPRRGELMQNKQCYEIHFR